MAGDSIGSVSVSVVPDAEGWVAKLESQILPQSSALGEQAGARFAAAFSEQLRGLDLPGGSPLSPERQGERGAAAGDAFGRTFASRIDAALRNLPDAKISAETSEADQKLRDLRVELEGLREDVKFGVDDGDTGAKLSDLEGRLRALGAESPNIRIQTNALAAAAELGTLQASLDRVTGKPLDDVKTSADGARQSFSLLKDVIVPLAPAIVPIAGAAAAAGAAFVALGAAGLLAFKGIAAEMHNGTELGKQYATGLGTLKDDLSSLERTAAGGVVTPFNAAVQQLNAQMPLASTQVGILSRDLGQIGGNTLTGLVSGFQTFGPLIDHVSGAVVTLSATFERWASGPGGQKFANGLGQAFDQVLPTVENLVGAAGHLIAALQPLGGSVLSAVNLLASALNAIPTQVLSTLAAGLVPLYEANRVAGYFSNLSQSLGGVSTKLGGLASSAGVIGAVAVATIGLGEAVSHLVDGGKAAVNAFDNSGKAATSYASALATSKGALDDGVKSTVAYVTQADGLTAKVARLGSSQDDLTTAVTGTVGEFSRYYEMLRAHGADGDTLVAVALERNAFQLQEQQILKNRDAFAQYEAAQSGVWASNKTTQASFAQVGSQLGLAGSQAQAYAQVLGISSDAVKNGTVTNGALASAVEEVSAAAQSAGPSVSALLSQMSAFGQSAGTAADKAKLFGAELQAGMGDALSTDNSVAQLYQTIDGLKGAFDKAGGSVINFKTGAIDLHNAGAAPLTQSLAQMQQQLVSTFEAQDQYNVSLGQDGVTAATNAVTSLQGNVKAFQDQMYAAGASKDAVEALTKQYFNIPPELVTKIEQQGGETVTTILDQIGQLLAALVGRDWTPGVGLDTTHFDANSAGVQNKLTQFDHTTTTPTANMNTGPYDERAAHMANNAGQLAAMRPTPVAGMNTGPFDASAGHVAGTVSGLNAQTAFPTADLNDNASAAIQNVAANLNALNGRHASTYVDNYTTNYTTAVFQTQGKAVLSANGNILNGAAQVQHFAAGGFENHVAQIAPAGAMRLWAEPETGGEAYIPLGQNKRDRSEKLLGQVAGMFGDQLVAGDTHNTSSTDARRQTTNHNSFTVVSPDPSSAAESVARRLEIALS